MSDNNIKSLSVDQASDPSIANNYVISFIDILGQQKALKGHGLLPVVESPEDHARFIETLRATIGPIMRLHTSSEELLKGFDKPSPSPFRESLSPELKAKWDAALRAKVTIQRWSDGLVSFISLGNNVHVSPLSGIMRIFASAGAQCFMGLASGVPMRGAIDIAWGVEIRPGELYGAAVARAYELESTYAQYPRIIVSPRAIEYLQSCINNMGNDFISTMNGEIAKLCLGIIAQDADGFAIVHYLGVNFQQLVSHSVHNEIYPFANQFVNDQLKLHIRSGESKLAFRYHHLAAYFKLYKPDNIDQGEPGDLKPK